MDGKHGGGYVQGKMSTEPAANGGYVIADASDYYRQLGIQKAHRHLFVAFSDPKEGTAILSTMDDIRSEKEHRYTWQLNVGGESASKDEEKPGAAGDSAPPVASSIRFDQGVEGGCPFFVMHGRKGYVKAWIPAPADATLKTGFPLGIGVKGRDIRYWVVMYVGTGTPIVAEVNGTGLDSVIKIGGTTVRWDAAADRIVAR